jgi:hypothetical protein
LPAVPYYPQPHRRCAGWACRTACDLGFVYSLAALLVNADRGQGVERTFSLVFLMISFGLFDNAQDRVTGLAACRPAELFEDLLGAFDCVLPFLDDGPRKLAAIGERKRLSPSWGGPEGPAFRRNRCLLGYPQKGRLTR